MTGITHPASSVRGSHRDGIVCSLRVRIRSFFPRSFRKLLEIFHKLSGDSLMTVFRDHIQSEYRLDLPVLSVKRDIMIKFIPGVLVYLWFLR